MNVNREQKEVKSLAKLNTKEKDIANILEPLGKYIYHVQNR